MEYVMQYRILKPLIQLFYLKLNFNWFISTVICLVFAEINIWNKYGYFYVHTQSCNCGKPCNL